MGNIKIAIECECGNKCHVTIPAKKSSKLRDELYISGFRLETDKVQSKPILIQCQQCKSWIELYLD